MTPEERAAKRYPLPTSYTPTADGWKALNHRADGYAACIREVVDPLEARIKELEETLSAVLDQYQNALDVFGVKVEMPTITIGRAILNKK